ncbi:4-coumarate--CoA ligase 1-like [Anopheles arabiensis]|uniref:Luciferin 4-monooxygenase n=1 Tax=Anopheles arabiensis TaxID=7173 RepID=A0A1I8JTC1_ANOAR|nr:4-coumarate--CoA ligase 1-like [Anopheles arabiensis]
MQHPAAADESFIVRGPPAPADLTLGAHSLGQLFLKVLQKTPHSVALVDGVTGREYSYHEVLQIALQLAAYLHDHNIQRGDVVAIVAENRYEYPVTVIALFLVGATVALFNPSYTTRELVHALNVARPKLVFVSSLARGSLLKASQTVKQPLLNVISYDALERGTSFAHCLQRSSKRFSVASIQPMSVEIAEEVAIIVMSSGTTGLPKGVLITHRNVMATMANVRDALDKGLSLHCSLDVLPWFHVAGGISMLSWLGANLTVVYLPRFEPRTYLRCIERYRPSFLNMVPPIVVFLAKHPAVLEYDLTSVQTIACGAAPLSREVEQLINERLSGIRIRQGYGMSETTQAITFYDRDTLKPGSIGTVRAGQMGKVVDVETGRALGPNQQGELCFKGSLIMKGYIGAERVIDADGWLHTGDIGYYDSDGDFFIVDRLKELIKYKAFQVPPAELEAVLLTNPGVKDCAVVGKADERAGELPLAFVVPTEGIPVTEEQLIQYVDERVSNEKRLRGGVRFVEEIPKTASGKILRRTLRELANQRAKL